MVGGLPFDVKQPGYNAETEAAIQEARDISSGKIPAKSFASVRELFEQLDSEC
jgi:DNA-damage-inducible protein J